ncbi:MAG TPA: patatin-like phospholipase family protein [Salinisphaeraceae bacterium]|nr:patatin-like phospholipase family protein [Salinisphaeraceae bacterium]
MADLELSEDQTFVLVLQGGGALGSYQAGLYQALAEAGIQPDWIIGTSIGAINGALIAGNPLGERVSRLRQFWHAISCDDFETWLPPAARHSQPVSYMNALRARLLGNPGFFMPRWTLGLEGYKPETASFYDTRPLRRTLQEHIDFEALNASDVQLSVGATSVTRGELVYFDSPREKICVEHILASSSLPPGFAATRLDDDVYWDGGVCSNSPLDKLAHDDPGQDCLCFAVHLWNQAGPEPASIMDVFARQKEIAYASRFGDEIKDIRRIHRLRHAISELYEALPKSKRDAARFQELHKLGSNRRIDIVSLGRKTQDWELATKDINFSWARILDHWEHGYQDGRTALQRAPWQQQDHAREGIFTHDFGPASNA